MAVGAGRGGGDAEGADPVLLPREDSLLCVSVCVCVCVCVCVLWVVVLLLFFWVRTCVRVCVD